MPTALASFGRHDFIFGILTMAVGVLVVAPLLIGRRTRQWAKRMLDGDIEFIGTVILAMTVIAFAICNNLSA